MQLKTILLTAGKLLLTGIVFFIGVILGGAAAGAAGLPAPAVPQGTDANTLSLFLLLAALVMAALLAWLARHLAGSFLRRWLSLSLFAWVVYALNTYIEAVIFTTYSSASPNLLVMDLVGVLLAAALACAWFRPPALAAPARAWWSARTPASWAWRLALVVLAFPLIYLAFGKLVEPLVIQVYRQQLYEMTAPGWGQILPAALLRSLLFLLSILPLLAAWQGSRRSLLWSLGAALFVLVGFLYMLQGYWLPPAFRLVHLGEILADSLVYAAVVVGLLVPARRSQP